MSPSPGTWISMGPISPRRCHGRSPPGTAPRWSLVRSGYGTVRRIQGEGLVEVHGPARYGDQGRQHVGGGLRDQGFLGPVDDGRVGWRRLRGGLDGGRRVGFEVDGSFPSVGSRRERGPQAIPCGTPWRTCVPGNSHDPLSSGEPRAASARSSRNAVALAARAAPVSRGTLPLAATPSSDMNPYACMAT